jgi:HAD superfamily hydrolase (TIGR01509 family)
VTESPETSTTNIQAIIFDHDGTLVDSEPVHHQIWQQTLSEFGSHELTMTQYQQTLSGRPTIDSARLLAHKFNLQVEPETLCQIKIDKVAARLQQQPFPLMPKVVEVLTFLQQQQVALAVASGAGQNEVVSSLKAHALEQFFRAVSTRHAVANNKPAPDVYLHAASKLNVPPERCLAVEDSDSGELSAISAGMHCLRLKTFTSLPHNEKTFYINDLTEIEEHFLALNQR